VTCTRYEREKYSHNHAVIMDRDSVLLFDGQTTFAQFMHKSVVINFLKEPDPDRVRNNECASDDLPGEVRKGGLICVHLCSSVVPDLPCYISVVCCRIGMEPQMNTNGHR
jgi:hypothetical protein